MKKIGLFLLFCILSTALFCQSPSLRTYSVIDGLAGSSVVSILQDSRGYLWIGTERGLSRFDGLEFRNYSVQDGLPGPFVKHIFEDRDRNIWLCTVAGLVKCWEDNYHRFHLKTFTVKDGLSHNLVTAVTQSADGSIWCASVSGLNRFDGKAFHVFSKKTHGLIDDKVMALAIDKSGKIWIGTNGGLSCYSRGEFTNYSMRDGLIDNRVRSVLVDNANRIWVGTAAGVSILDKRTFTSYNEKNGLVSGWVESMMQDHTGNIWVAAQEGVSLFREGRITNYNSSNGFPADKFYTIYQDREKNIWFGTIRGLCKLFSTRFEIFYERDGLSNSYVWSITQDRGGDLWFATENGLNRYSGGKFKFYGEEDGLPSKFVFELDLDRKGDLWCATFKGVSKLTPSTGKFTNYSTKDGLPDNIIPGLLVDHAGITWVGTNRGLCRIINGKISPLPIYQKKNSVNRFLEDSDNAVWFNSKLGLYRVSPDRQSIKHYTVNDGLADNTIYSLCEDRNKKLWIGTDRGLSCFYEGKFKNYLDTDGLLENPCYFVEEDAHGMLWIGSGRGISRFDGETFINFTNYDGVPGREVVDGSCFRDRDGYMWFGTVKGLVRFLPKKDPLNYYPPPVYISRFAVMDEEYPFFKTNQFEHNQNTVEIDFRGISFSPPEAIKYRYRLDGIDREWKETRERSVSYPYLPPGDYFFQVVALNRDGFESPVPRNVRFHIKLPFWRTWWFQLIAVLAVLLAVVGILLWRIKRTRELVLLQERNKQLVMAQKMELLGILAGGAVHDLKNLLAVILAYSKIAGELVKETPDVIHEQQNTKKSNAIEKIKSTALTAVQVVKQILAFTKQSYDTTIAANLPDLVDDILEILTVSTPEEVTISWERPEQEIRLFINPTRLQQILMNLCLNAIQAMPDGGTLTIRLYKQSDRAIVLEVSDTGIGMEQETINKIFDPLFTTKKGDKGTGLGLFVVNQIVEEYNGTIKVQSVPSQGTTFIISFNSE